MSAFPQFDASYAETSLTAVLDALTDAACLIDAGGRIFFFNKPFANFWRDRFDAEPHLGMHVGIDAIAGCVSIPIGEGTAIIIRDDSEARERETLARAIQRKGKEWALTFDAIELPIFLTSADGVVVRMNRAGRDLRSEERRVGKESRSRWAPY